MVFLLLALHIDGHSTSISVLNVAILWIFITEFITAYRMLQKKG